MRRKKQIKSIKNLAQWYIQSTPYRALRLENPVMRGKKRKRKRKKLRWGQAVVPQLTADYRPIVEANNRGVLMQTSKTAGQRRPPLAALMPSFVVHVDMEGQR